MQREASTFERITLKFLITLDFKLQKKWINETRYYYDTLKLWLFNQTHELSVEEIGHILQFPIYEPGDVPNDFDAKKFWYSISGGRSYTSVGAKASTIQNPCFQYAQKAFVFTLSRQDDSTGVATQRGFFLSYCMTTNGILNVFAFPKNYLGKVDRVATKDTSVGGMVNQIAKFPDFEFNLVEENVVEGNSKIDMDALVHQRMIYMDGSTYMIMIHNKSILDFPNPRKVRIDVPNNWLYQLGTPYLGNLTKEEGEPDNSNHLVGTTMEEDIVPPPTLLTQYEAGTSSSNQDRWEWVQSEIGKV